MSGYEEWCRNVDSQRGTIVGLAYENDITGGSWAKQQEASTGAIFAQFKCGDPDRVDTMIEHLTEAKYVLGKDLREHLGGAQLDMDGWRGEAADNFRDWLLKLEDAINLLADCVEALILVLKAYKAVVLAMRNDVLQLVDKTLQGIEEAEADGWKIALAVVGAVVGVVAAIPSGGLSLAAVGAVSAAMVTGGTSVAIEVMDADSENGVIQEMIKAGWSMIGKINEESGRIKIGLYELSNFVSGAKLAEVRPDRPLVITAPSFDPGSFGMTDEAQGNHKRPTDTTDLVPEPKRRPDGPYDKAGGIFGPEYDEYEEQGPA